MQIVKGFPSTSQDDYQLNVTNIIKRGARNFGRQEIASRKPDGTINRMKPWLESELTEDGFWKSGDAGTIDPEG